MERLRPREVLLGALVASSKSSRQAGIGRLLAAAPRLQVIATSRQPLDIYGEHRFDVPPLGVGEFRTSPAETLFLERARAARRGYADPADLAVVTDVCRRLAVCRWRSSSRPRAITATPARLLAQLEHSLDLTSGGPADYTPRQRSMRGALDWSYALLSAPERRVFTALSTFAGGCTIEAVAGVIGPDEATGEIVEALVDEVCSRTPRSARSFGTRCSRSCGNTPPSTWRVTLTA